MVRVILSDITPVSYTHLDVYKRQDERQLRDAYHASTIEAVPDLTGQRTLCSKPDTTLFLVHSRAPVRGNCLTRYPKVTDYSGISAVYKYKHPATVSSVHVGRLLSACLLYTSRCV